MSWPSFVLARIPACDVVLGLDIDDAVDGEAGEILSGSDTERRPASGPRNYCNAPQMLRRIEEWESETDEQRRTRRALENFNEARRSIDARRSMDMSCEEMRQCIRWARSRAT